MTLEEQKYNREVLKEADGNDLISAYFNRDRPFFVARAGATECKIISCLIKERKALPDLLARNALVLSGINPNTEENLVRFSLNYCQSIKSVDIMAVLAAPNYDWLVNTYCPNAHLIRLWGLEPYHFSSPWSKNLEGKNVLVIHPFEQSIRNNYKNRKNLFENPDVLPEFNLLTIKAEQNLNNASSDFFESMKRTMDKINQVKFDVAILGCGASGLPLASYIKKDCNKTAIRLGGATQMLFGIIGRRWEAYPQCQKIINKHWTRPLSEEVPEHYLDVEGGCYW